MAANPNLPLVGCRAARRLRNGAFTRTLLVQLCAGRERSSIGATAESFVDLSEIHEKAFAEFVAAYEQQVARTDYTDRERIDTLRLKILNITLTAADWIRPIQGAIADTIYVLGGAP